MSDFEQRLVASMRYGAEQARPVSDPMTVVSDRADRHRHRGKLVALAGLVALFVIALPGVLLAANRAGHGPAGVSISYVGPGGHAPIPYALPGVSAWELTTGLFSDHAGVHPVRALAVTVPAGGFAFLIVAVNPRNPGGKTYLQQLTATGWVKLGPHQLDARSRVSYLLWPPTGAVDATYRVYVPAANGVGAAYSVPVTVRLQH